MKCTNEQYARALLLRLLQRGPLRARDVMAVMEENALADVAREAMAGLGVAAFKQHGELIFALPPNVVGFFPPQRRPHAHRFPGAARGEGNAA